MLKLLFIALPLTAAIGLLILGGFYISPQDELTPANAIIVVSGGDTKGRTLEAVKLYQQGWAPLMIFSGAALDPESPSNARAMRDIAIAEGVPSDVIAIEEESLNTRQNANQVSTIIQALKYPQVILVTSPYHQRRAFLEFTSRLGEETIIINHSAPDKNWSRAWWWTRPLGWYLTLTEVPKTMFALLNQQLSPM